MRDNFYGAIKLKAFVFFVWPSVCMNQSIVKVNLELREKSENNHQGPLLTTSTHPPPMKQLQLI